MQHAGTTGALADVQDAGLRAHMLRVYNTLTGGIALSSAVAAAVAFTGLQGLFFAQGPRGVSTTLLGMLVMLAPLGMLLVAMFRKPETWTESGTKAFYWAFVALQGVGLSVALISYGTGDVVRALLATTAAFAGLSIWGYTSQRSLDAVGSFCVMGLFGMIGIALLGLLTGFTVSSTVMGIVGVIVFAGLTAWDTQKIKLAYLEGLGDEGRVVYWSALTLFLDAVNLFWSILRLTGGGSSRSSD